ncbi:MAG: endonuclease/exonuclease/phosphatase family protein [Sedimenticola sp.]
MDTIVQWNCRGIKPNKDEISLLIQDYNPIAVCLQETFLKDTDLISFKSYAMYNKCSDNVVRASGGVSILVNSFQAAFLSTG